jgi:hypothetical protein
VHLPSKCEREQLSHPVLRLKLNALPLCVPESSFTHKATNSEINSKPVFITTQLITKPRGLNGGKGHHATGRRPGPARLEEVFINELLISEQ